MIESHLANIAQLQRGKVEGRLRYHDRDGPFQGRVQSLKCFSFSQSVFEL
jgi:hypothetical protein